MIHFNSLAISLLTVISMAPASQAFTNAPAISQPAANLQAQLTIIIGSPAPIPQTVVIETVRRQPEPVYRVPSRWEISRDRHEEFSRHDRFRDKHSKHSKHRRDRDEDRREYRQESRHEHRH
jgi:hypothetical protein